VVESLILSGMENHSFGPINLTLSFPRIPLLLQSFAILLLARRLS